jgi:hypothetical protein
MVDFSGGTLEERRPPAKRGTVSTIQVRTIGRRDS